MLVVCAMLGCYGGSSAPTNVAFVYEVGDGSNAIQGLGQRADGTLSALPTSPYATSPRPVAMALHPSKNFLYVVNSTSNTVSGYTLDHTSGVLAPVGQALPPSPTGPLPISAGVNSGGQFLFVLNTGTAAGGSISVYSIDTTRGILAEISGSPFPIAANPLAMAVSPSAGFLYVSSASPSAISVFAIAGNGALSAAAGSVTGATGSNFPGLTIDPKGQFLYAADSGNNQVDSFSIAASGALTPVAGSPFPAGTQPAAVAVDSTGTLVFVSNAGSDDVSAYTSSAGVLTQAATSPFTTKGTGTVAAAQPGFLTVDTSNTFLYVCNVATKGLAVFSINGSDGSLTPLANSPFPQGLAPRWLVITK